MAPSVRGWARHALLKVDLKLQQLDIWASLRGQVLGLLDWDMGNKAFLAFTSHLPMAEQNLARYRLQIVEPPRLPLEKKPRADRDGPEFEPNLWMWVNPNIVYPPGKLEAQGAREKKELAGAVPRPRLPCHQEDASCPEAAGAGHCRLPPPSSLRRQSTFCLPPVAGSSRKRRPRTRMTAPVWLSCPLTKGPPSRAGGFSNPAARRKGSGPGPLSITST